MRQTIVSLPRVYKRLLMLCLDVAGIIICIAAALTLRYGSLEWIGRFSQVILFCILLTAVVSSVPFFIKMGLYRAVLRYINSTAFFTIVRACAFAAITFVVIDAVFLPLVVLPRSVPFLYFSLLSIYMVSTRYFIQRWLVGDNIQTALGVLVKSPKVSVANKGQRAIVVGDRANVAELIRALDKTSAYCPMVIISSDKAAHGGEVCGRKVYSLGDLFAVIEEYEPQVALLAAPHLSRLQRMEIIHDIKQHQLPIKTVPELNEIFSDKIRIEDIREINILDVLWREEVKPNKQLLEQNIRDKVVLVTGAGGSIGSEIARQVIHQKPKKLICLDHAEYNLYAIEQELIKIIRECDLAIVLEFKLISVMDEKAVWDVFHHESIHTIFHAAGYKHVPLVEQNWAAGIENNTCGTLIVAGCAIAAKTEHFVLISTDKAVRPTNVMGASKRLAEMALQALSQKQQVSSSDIFKDPKLKNHQLLNQTNLSMVRFGNVLGSSGSVIPLFTEQIKNGGPITVTHKEIIRYFMSIPEAAQLVIQASSLANSGEICLLDMGAPIKIIDLAKRMIELSGLTVKDELNPLGDIAIEVSGLRPGEKLYEELLIEDNALSTGHPKIFKAQDSAVSWEQIMHEMDALSLHLSSGETEEFIQRLNRVANATIDIKVNASVDLNDKSLECVA
ncbi:MAG: nucleoside-diphosphate sugar epimerase/dehydratase [Cellvibrionales bacterium]|nr:nucleoside-diphosphate sugar epimerase/dehydratase [Cellvibrionales bacterium]